MSTDKSADRPMRNYISALAMLGHLCSLYDQGIFEAGRLMSNLLYQLVIQGRNNRPLLDQVGYFGQLRITVDEAVLNANMSASPTMSPLVTLIFGLKRGADGSLRPAANWLPPTRRPPPFGGFVTLSLNEWLEDRVIPCVSRVMNRRDLITVVRDQDGGARSDGDAALGA